MTEKYIEEYVLMNDEEREKYVTQRREELSKLPVEELSNMIIDLERDEEHSGGWDLYQYKKVKVKLIDKLNKVDKGELIRIIMSFESRMYHYRGDIKRTNINLNDRFEELNKMNFTDLVNYIIENNLYNGIIEE